MEELYEVPDEFMVLEKQAIECSLNGISPVDEFYSYRACSKFDELVMDKELTLNIMDRVDQVSHLYENVSRIKYQEIYFTKKCDLCKKKLGKI